MWLCSVLICVLRCCCCSLLFRCSLEQVTRILKEAEALGSDAESDPLCKQLSDVATAAKTWMDSSKEMLDRLKGLAALGKEAVARDVAEAISAAKAHLELAAGLRVKVGATIKSTALIPLWMLTCGPAACYWQC